MLRWAIYNSLKGWALYDLTDREITLLVKTLSVNEVRLTQVSQQGAAQWRALNSQDFPDFFELIVSPNRSHYPPLEVRPREGNDTEFFSNRPQKTIHPRLHQRYEIAISCTIFSSSRQFTAATVDLSEGGIYFQDTIPDWVAGYFLVVVQAPARTYQLMCSVVEDQKERQRIQIECDDVDPQFIAYKNWLLSLGD